jgi:phosphatidylglycerophosphate synthase
METSATIQQGVLLNTTESTTRRPPWLAGLPTLLRSVLTAQRAGLEKLLIVGGKDPGKLLRRRRITLDWNWIPAEDSSATATVDDRETDLLRQVNGKVDGNFVLLFSDSIFDVEALQTLRELPLNGQVARRVIDPKHPQSSMLPGLFLCSPQFLETLSNGSNPAEHPGRICDYALSLPDQTRVKDLETEGRSWGRASGAARLREIERELAHFNLKLSDGIFARFNKLVLAEPLIRFFLHTPASPNFITFLGLLFALGGGLVAAHGGYFWTLGGALLNFISAILDHVDGMVARLKFQESHFGTWFETMVDYTSYVAIFGGLAVGVYRETGEAYNLVFYGLFILAALIAIPLQLRQRQRTANDNPADYINRLHVSLDKKQDDFIHWVSRNFYFVVRRAVLPYFIVFFCLLSMRELLLGWVALGSQVRLAKLPSFSI